MSKKKQKKTEFEEKRSTRCPEIARGHIAGRERLLKNLEQLTLLSDVFMSVVLSDIEACQHVVRILTADPFDDSEGELSKRVRFFGEQP